ncbi:MAG TPA: sulfatase [Vicinamibacterales bacterium]|nr:sulfatase [Vicinamibacterales bacterium]
MQHLQRRFAILAGALATVLASAGALSAQSRPPNIVMIVGDDMGYGDIGIHGSKDIPTPNIDALARAGIRFTDAYVTGPHCSPTRAGLLTGRYQQRFGHEVNMGPGAGPNGGLPLGETTMADRLKAAGYRTALFGKWHLGSAEPFHPLSRGFDEFYGFLGGEHSYFESSPNGANPLMDGRTRVEASGYLTDVLTDRAVAFIKREKARPFFLYLAYNAVHTPMHAPEKYLTRFMGIADEQRRTYAAMMSAMDDGIGRTLDALRAEKLEEDTLVFFFSDNGGPTMPTTTINGSTNTPLRGSKRQTWEGGIRVPFIIRWKGRLAEQKIDSRPIIQLDVLPTALAAAGVESKAEWKLDGVNLLPFLTGKLNGTPHETLYWRLFAHMAIRKGPWKLVKSAEGPLLNADTSNPDLSGAQLFNLVDDIGEKNDLATAHPEKVKELADDWLRWSKEMATPLWGPGAGGRGAPPR